MHFTVGSAIPVGLQQKCVLGCVPGKTRVQGTPGQLAWPGRGSRPPLLPQPALCRTDPTPAWPSTRHQHRVVLPRPCSSGTAQYRRGLSRTLLRAAPVTLTTLWSRPSSFRHLGSAGCWWLPLEVHYFAFVKTEAVIYLPTADSSRCVEPGSRYSPGKHAVTFARAQSDSSDHLPVCCGMCPQSSRWPQGPRRGSRGDPCCTQTSPAVNQPERHLLPRVPVPERPHRPHGHQLAQPELHSARNTGASPRPPPLIIPSSTEQGSLSDKDPVFNPTLCSLSPGLFLGHD